MPPDASTCSVSRIPTQEGGSPGNRFYPSSEAGTLAPPRWGAGAGAGAAPRVRQPELTGQQQLPKNNCLRHCTECWRSAAHHTCEAAQQIKSSSVFYILHSFLVQTVLTKPANVSLLCSRKGKKITLWKKKKQNQSIWSFSCLVLAFPSIFPNRLLWLFLKAEPWSKGTPCCIVLLRRVRNGEDVSPPLF